MNANQKSVLVTGAGRGLGYALCAEFLSRGWEVYALVRNPTSADLLKKLGVRLVIQADLSEDQCIVQIGQKLENVKLDLLINNAGVPGAGKNIETLDFKNVSELFEIHCLGVGRMVRAALAALRGSPRPTVLNISSRLSSMALNNSGAYDAVPVSYSYRIAKAAQNMLTVCLHKELGPTGVHVFALHPGEIVTGTQSRDAKQTPAEAAANVYNFVERAATLEPGLLYRTSGEIIAW